MSGDSLQNLSPTPCSAYILFSSPSLSGAFSHLSDKHGRRARTNLEFNSGDEFLGQVAVKPRESSLKDAAVGLGGWVCVYVRARTREIEGIR